MIKYKTPGNTNEIRVKLLAVKLPSQYWGISLTIQYVPWS